MEYELNRGSRAHRPRRPGFLESIGGMILRNGNFYCDSYGCSGGYSGSRW